MDIKLWDVWGEIEKGERPLMIITVGVEDILRGPIQHTDIDMYEYYVASHHASRVDSCLARSEHS